MKYNEETRGKRREGEVKKLPKGITTKEVKQVDVKSEKRKVREGEEEKKRRQGGRHKEKGEKE